MTICPGPDLLIVLLVLLYSIVIPSLVILFIHKKKEFKSKALSILFSIFTFIILFVILIIISIPLLDSFTPSCFEGDSLSFIEQRIQDYFIDNLAQSNEPLYFPYQLFMLAPGEDHVDGIGIKNTGDIGINLKVQFYVKVGDGYEKFNPEEGHKFSSGDEKFTAKIFWDDSIQIYKPEEIRVIFFRLTPPKKLGDYLFKVSILEDGQEDKVFTTKTFFVKVG